MESKTGKEEWMKRAIALAIENARSVRGGPFGTLVVRENLLVATGVNTVTSTNDPTAHAEIAAIRSACLSLACFRLDGCEIYSSCEPCPMCLGAIYWARPAVYYYASTRQSAAAAGFDDAFIYDELILPPGQRSIPGHRLSGDSGLQPFKEWSQNSRRVLY